MLSRTELRLEAAYPSLAKLYSIGQTVQGRNIIVLQVSEYQTLSQLQEEWRGLEAAYPSLAKLYSIGQTVQGRNIIVLQVSEYQNPCRNIFSLQEKPPFQQRTLQT